MRAGAALKTVDEETWMDVRDGAEWFEEAVDRHARLAFRVAYAVLRNHADAEDAVQETFLRVYKAGTDGIEDVPAWVARIAYRAALDLLRTRKHEDVDALELADGREAHDEVLSREQQVKRLRALIAGLPEELRHPLILSELQELTSRQVGEILGIPDGTVRTRVMRARQMLKERFETVERSK